MLQMSYILTNKLSTDKNHITSTQLGKLVTPQKFPEIPKQTLPLLYDYSTTSIIQFHVVYKLYKLYTH